MSHRIIENVRTLRCIINNPSNTPLKGNDVELVDGYITIKCDHVFWLDDGLLMFRDAKGVPLQVIHSKNISIIDIIYKS
jgi:hypothetical protein